MPSIPSIPAWGWIFILLVVLGVSAVWKMSELGAAAEELGGGKYERDHIVPHDDAELDATDPGAVALLIGPGSVGGI